MKTLISSTGNKATDKFDLRFGRAPWFCLYDNETKKSSFHENEQINSSHGAGPKVAEKAFELGATKVISGDFGPKAADILNKLKIQMVIIENDNQSIEDIISQLNK